MPKADPDFEVDLTGMTSSEEEAEEEPEAEEEDLTASPPAAAAAKKKKAPAAKKPRTSTTPAKRPAKPPAALAPLAGDAAALAAVAAVDAAAAALPPEDALGITFMSEAFAGGRPPDEPAAAGSLPPPRGHPDCLTGKTFVITGVLQTLRRGEAEDAIKRHGGKVTGAVSGRTTFLVVGQQTGRSKYAVAREKGVKMVNEAGLRALIVAAPPPAEPMEAEAEAAPAAAAAPAAPISAAALVPRAGAGGGGAGPSRPPRAAGAAAPRPPAAGGQLWVEKWRPAHAKDLVGNQQVVATLRQWLRDWERVVLRGGEPAAPPGAGRKDRGAELRKRAVLLSGSPGVGKTSAALIVCRELGFEPIEVNASDSRGKVRARRRGLYCC